MLHEENTLQLIPRKLNLIIQAQIGMKVWRTHSSCVHVMYHQCDSPASHCCEQKTENDTGTSSVVFSSAALRYQNAAPIADHASYTFQKLLLQAIPQKCKKVQKETGILGRTFHFVRQSKTRKEIHNFPNAFSEPLSSWTRGLRIKMHLAVNASLLAEQDGDMCKWPFRCATISGCRTG